MRIRSLTALTALSLACARPADRSAQDTAAAAPPTPAEHRAIVTVLYNHPKDHTAFEKYYAEVHLPLVVAKQGEIGHTSADLFLFDAGGDGAAPAMYRQAELYFPSMDALRQGTATAGFKAVGDDLANFATGGLVALIAEETSPATAASAAPGAVFTVIYKEPADTAAFEKYYAESHLPLVQQHATEIGFTKAELTRFVSNLDGSKRAYYRQAQLFFASSDDLKRGTATPGFKAVADDLPKFATGGFVVMVGHETR